MVDAEPNSQTDLLSRKAAVRAFPVGIKSSNRISGAFLCSMEATLGMVEVALIISLWAIQVGLALCLAMIMAVVSGRR